MRWVSASTRAEALAALGIHDVEHRCRHCGSTQHGQPEGNVSLSHAGGLTLAVLADGPVGIDHEPLEADAPWEVVAHPSDSGDALRLWVRKEAVLKATGLGLAVDPRSFWLDVAGRPSPIPGYDGPLLTVVDLEIPGFLAALASCE